jgi:glycosyltransferase involved in cell wall biosynthesis
MRVLVHAVAAKMGGALRQLKGLLSALSKLDNEREYFFLVNSLINLPQVSENIKLIRSPLHGETFINRIIFDQLKVPRIAKRYEPDVIISLLNFGPLKPEAKQIVFERNPVYFCPSYLSEAGLKTRTNASLRRLLIKKTIDASELVIVPTRSMGQMIRDYFPEIPADKFRVIHHGIDFSFFPEGEEVKKEMGAEINLLYATLPAPHKGYPILFNGVASLVKGGTQIKLILTMDEKSWPKQTAEYKKMIKDLGIEEKVEFIGSIPQQSMKETYRKADIFIYPSLCESFGFPGVEAMAMGLPIVAADTPVFRELLSPSALFYPPKDGDALAERVRELIKNEQLRKRLSKKGREKARGFSFERQASELIELIEEI